MNFGPVKANYAPLERPEALLNRQHPDRGSDQFVDFDIDDGLSEGETNLDFHNDMLMKDEATREVRVEASRSKLVSNKKRYVFS